MTTEEQLRLSHDRLKYVTNKLSSNFALLAILFNAFFFVNIFRTLESEAHSFYYTIEIGLSVLCNLLFMLTAFLSSEGVKNYKKTYAYVLIGLAILQIIRIFILPLQAFTTDIPVIVDEVETTKKVMGVFQFSRAVYYLVVSFGFSLAAGITALIRTNRLEKYIKEEEIEKQNKQKELENKDNITNNATVENQIKGNAAVEKAVLENSTIQENKK